MEDFGVSSKNHAFLSPESISDREVIEASVHVDESFLHPSEKQNHKEAEEVHPEFSQDQKQHEVCCAHKKPCYIT